MITSANQAVDGLLVADGLDAVSAALLRAAAIDDDTARVILAELWR